jgi:hypothetical protein
VTASGRFCCKSLFKVTNEIFLELLMRPAPRDMRDPSFRRKTITDLRIGATAFQRYSHPKINFREIFAIVRFSTCNKIDPEQTFGKS